MWELVILALIAGRTCKYNIIGVIAWSKISTRNGNSMIKVIDIRLVSALLKFAKAIIAGVVLGFQFALNLLYCQCSLKVSQTSAASLLVDTSLGKVQGASPLMGLLFPLVNLFPMGIAIVSRLCKHLFMVRSIVLQMPGAFPFAVFSIMVLSSLIDFFTVNGQVVILLRTSLFTVPLILLSFLLFDFFGVIFTVLPLLCAYLFTMLLIVSFAIFNTRIVVGFSSFTSTFFARSTQSDSAFMEELKSSREPLQALRTSLLRGIVLGYTVHTVRLQSLSSRLGMCQHRSGTTLLPLHYTINQHHKQVQEVYCCADCGSRNIVHCEIG